MGKLAPALTALGLAATLTACGSEAAPAPAPTPSVAASPTPSPFPTASPAPTPPVMPRAAKAYTDNGARAFVVHYWKTVDYASTTLDTKPLENLSGESCASCWSGINGLEDDAERGARFIGGEQTVSGATVARFADERLRAAMVTYTVTSAEQTKVLPNGKRRQFPGETLHERMTLRWANGRWQAAQLDLLK